MKRILSRIEWCFDYYLVYLMYNERKADRYYQFMNEKWNLKNEKSDFQTKNKFQAVFLTRTNK